MHACMHARAPAVAPRLLPLTGGPPCRLACSTGNASWVKLNAGQYGYYRVRYGANDGHWPALAAAARWGRWANGAGAVHAAASLVPPAALHPLASCLRSPPASPPLAHPSPPPCPRSAPAPTGSGVEMALGGADLAGLIDDAFSLAEAGEGPISRFLDLLL